MYGIVHNYAESNGRNDRRRYINLSNQIAPQSHRHHGWNEIRNQADQTEPDTSEYENKQQRDDGHRNDGADQHFFYVSLNRICAYYRNSGCSTCHLRSILLQPIPRTVVELYLLAYRQTFHHSCQASFGPFDIHNIVQVASNRQRKLVEQQVLRRKFGVAWKRIEFRIVAMQILVQAL